MARGVREGGSGWGKKRQEVRHRAESSTSRCQARGRRQAESLKSWQTIKGIHEGRQAAGPGGRPVSPASRAAVSDGWWRLRPSVNRRTQP